MTLPDPSYLDAHLDAIRDAEATANQAHAIREVLTRVNGLLEVGANPTVQTVIACLETEAARYEAHVHAVHRTLRGQS